MNGRYARQLRKNIGGIEIMTERKYVRSEDGSFSLILLKSSARKKYQECKKEKWGE